MQITDLNLPKRHCLPTKGSVRKATVPHFEEATWRSSNRPSVGCGSLIPVAIVGAVVGFLVGAAIAGNAAHLTPEGCFSGTLGGMFIGGVVAPGLIGAVLQSAEQSRIDRECARRSQEYRKSCEQAERQYAADEATAEERYQRDLETMLRTVAVQTENDIAHICTVGANIDYSLRLAQQQFDTQAYGLMYETMASVAVQFDYIKQASGVVANNVQCYLAAAHEYSGSRREPFNAGRIPPMEDRIDQANRLVMKAETMPTCTMIWEQKRTQRVIVEGFSGLGEAISGLGFTLQNSLSSLGNAICSVNASVNRSLSESARRLESVQGSLEDVRSALDDAKVESERGRRSLEQVKGWEVGTGHYIKTKNT